MSAATSQVRWAAICTAAATLLSCRVTPGPTFEDRALDGNCYTYALAERGPARNPDVATLRPVRFPDDCVSGWPIALALSPTDYHWWRRDAGGWWSHKQGRTAPSNTDYVGNLVVSPETTNRGPYEHFVGYFCAGGSP